MKLCEIQYKDIDDEMGTGLSTWEKAQNAKERNAENQHLASESIQQLADDIKARVVSVYTDVRVFVNFTKHSAAVKVGGVRQRDLISREVAKLNDELFTEYKIQPRRVGSSTTSTIIYHIPYDMEENEEHTPRKFRRNMRRAFGKTVTAKPRRGSFRPDLSKAKKPTDLPSLELSHLNRVRQDRKNREGA